MPDFMPHYRLGHLHSRAKKKRRTSPLPPPTGPGQAQAGLARHLARCACASVHTPGYVSDHWCTKGHVLLCLSGELHRAGRRPAVPLTPGMSYQVADNAEPHRSCLPTGATLFIVD